MTDIARERKKVLIADDSRLVRRQVASLLERCGYDTLEAANGAEALKLLGQQEDVDLVVLDVVMPVLDGRAVIRQIRSDERLSSLPILVLTATEHINMVAECTGAGSDDFLVKPVSPRLLYQRVQSLIEQNPRSYRRVECSVLAEVSTGPVTMTAEMREIGEGGAGLLLDTALDLGDIVRITFSLPKVPGSLTVGGEVIYTREEGGKVLSGIRFVIIDRQTRDTIAAYVQQEMPVEEG